MSYTYGTISIQPHHIKQNICGSRAKYRDGNKDRAVKVYTVNQESAYLIIANVSAVGGSEDLRGLCDQYGIVDEFITLDDYPCEDFTEAYLVKYNSFPSARTAKKQLDDKSFLGNSLHVFYAPEFETPVETSIKLQERRKYVAWKSKSPDQQNKPSTSQTVVTKPKMPSIAEKNLAAQPVTYVWAGKEYTVYPDAPKSQEPIADQASAVKSSSTFVPRQLKQKSSDSSFHDLNYSQNTSSTSANLLNVNESSYLNTVSNVRSKISRVSVPNVRVSSKRKRKI